MATTSDQGAIRAAMAALWANGGFQVAIRFPGLAASGSDAEQLGLGTPQFEDVPVGPAVWRKAGVNTSLVLGASAVASLIGSQAFAGAESLFQTAVGVVIGDVLYVITKAEPLLVAGTACAYRLSVKAPVWA